MPPKQRVAAPAAAPGATDPAPARGAYQAYARWLNGTARLLPSRRPHRITTGRDPDFLWYRVAKVGTRTILKELEARGARPDPGGGFNRFHPLGAHRAHFKFAFVRDPWDRFASAWRDKVLRSNYFRLPKAQHEKLRDFAAFVAFAEALDLDVADHHLRLQSRLVDLDAVDFLGRYERFEADLAEVFGRLGLPDHPPRRANRSANRSAGPAPTDPYDDDLRDRVGRLYRRDAAIFGYPRR